MRRHVLSIFVLVALISCSAKAGLTININAKSYSVDNPLSILLGPGDWVLTPINVDMGGNYTAWDAWGTSQRWLNFYVIESASISQTIVGDWGVYYSTPQEAFEHASTYAFSLSQQETIYLSTTDSTAVSYDNQGGISLYLHGPSEQIPAPGAIILGSLGAGVVGWLRRRRAI